MKKTNALIKGFYRDVLTDGNGALVHDGGWIPNTIVNRCHILLAGFMNNESCNGIQFLAVGSGDPSWDEDGPPAPTEETTELVNDHSYVIDADRGLKLAYLDDNDLETTGPTNRLQVTATLDPGVPEPEGGSEAYPLREFGLFGIFGDDEYMVNCIRHPVIYKDKSATLIRTVRLHF